MRLKTLLKDHLELIKGSKDVVITGITSHSKKVAPGNLFIAKKGMTHNGSSFIAEALNGGAVCLLTDMYDPFLKGMSQIVSPNIEEIEALVASRFYGHPTKKLFLVGVTGTNGKTTSTYMIKHLLDALNASSGLIGTVEWIVGKQHLPSSHTTPDLMTNYKLFHDMVQNGCKAATMEVSSHALVQGRVRGIEFDVAIFTNLTLDHLDYHGTIEHYAAAKAKLFSQCKVAVINQDSPWASFMIEKCSSKVLTYGITSSSDVQALDIKLKADGTEFTVSYNQEKVLFKTSLIGRFNVYNALGAIAVCLAKGISLQKIASLLSSFKSVQGRLERVENTKGIHVFVDYAHTDDALSNVLLTLKEFAQGRLITVFGCGGDRDQAKRPKMGSVAEALSDYVIVTSDNPRTEDPLQIIKQILVGIKNPKHILVEPDRAEAIKKALRAAKPGDIVLIAGKGHETYQIFSDATLPFDDREIVREHLR